VTYASALELQPSRTTIHRLDIETKAI